MKTLHLTNCWHPCSGGVSMFYRALFETANREAHHMRLVVPGPATSVEQVGRFGRIYNIEAPRAPLNADYRLVLPHRFLLPRTALQRIINEEQPDLIEVSDKYATHYLAGLLRTRRLPGVRLRPTVVGMSHERMDENVAAYLAGGQGARRFCNWYMKWVYFPMFDHHITVSEHVAQELIHASRGHKVRRGIWVSPMGVDCERFTPVRKCGRLRRQLLDLMQADDNYVLLLYAGRLAPEKNLALLIETMALLDPARYRLGIAGSGVELERMRRECAGRNLSHVMFLGHIADREELAGYYANFDIFLHPNPREPFGIAPLEAMAAGLALVAPRAGGLTTYADDANAWLTEATPAAFAATVRAVHGGKAAAARKTAEQYSWPRVTSQYLRLYRQLDAITQGEHAAEAIAARTYSTTGDWLGRELIEL